MVTHLGTFLGTELGTDLGTFQDGAVAFDPTKLYAIAALTSVDRFATANGGGEAGDISTGFGILSLVQLRSFTGAGQTYSSRSGGAAEGYFHTINSSNQIAFQAKGTSTFLASPNYQFTASDVGKLFFTIGLISPSGLVRLFLARAERGAGTAQTGYVAPGGSVPATLSGLANAVQPASGFGIVAEASFRGMPSDAQLVAVYDLVRAASDIPSKAALEAVMPGTTVTHRNSLRDVLTLANLPVADGAAAPASIPDSVTAASIDAMAKTGSPVVRVIDPSVDGRVSYGVQGFGDPTGASASAPGYASIAGANTGIVGNALGWYIQSWTRISETAVATFWGTRFRGNDGYLFDTNGTDLRCRMGTGSALVTSPTVTRATYSGQWALVTAVFDQPAGLLRLYVNGVQIGTGTAMATYSPNLNAADSFYIGRYSANGGALGGGAIGQTSGGDVIPTADDLLAQYAATLAAGKLVPLVGAAHTYDLDLDAKAAGNAVPTTAQDRKGADHLSFTGSGTLQLSQRKERLWSYETSPILYGADGYTLTDYFEAAINAMPGDPAGFTTSVLCSFQTLGAGRRLFAQRDTAGGGWEYQANASQVFFACSNGTTAATSPGSTITSDVGKLLLFTGVWDDAAKSVRLYAKRAQVSTGSALAAGYLPNTGIKPMIGRANSGAPTPGTAIYGVYYAPGVPTLAQVQAQFDAVQANESIQAVPGLPGVLIDLKRDLVSGSVPATLIDRGAGGMNFTRIGAPTAFPQYARAFGW